MTVVLAATAAEPNAGWGKLLALVITVAVFAAGASAHKRWLAVKGKPLSPVGDGVTPKGINSQASGPADPAVTPSQEVATKADTDLDVFVAEQVGRVRPVDIIEAARARYRVSEATVKRRIRRARMGGQP